MDVYPKWPYPARATSSDYRYKWFGEYLPPLLYERHWIMYAAYAFYIRGVLWGGPKALWDASWIANDPDVELKDRVETVFGPPTFADVGGVNFILFDVALGDAMWDAKGILPAWLANHEVSSIIASPAGRGGPWGWGE